MCFVTYTELTYNRVYTYPTWGVAIGWSMATVPILMVPLVMIYKLWKTPGTMAEVRIQQHNMLNVGLQSSMSNFRCISHHQLGRQNAFT